ncbi:bacteriocin-protection, YdeI or OmpD-associated protein [Formosa agariphila KMM 3901]|uniref:Bacteriocin-protection, YdeI or OmpD-associated protein n=1 Tax=Formosa agariphila (strain DSM 15362 / KCTC 12365 / LMG 23005 / KMM 3901 / M-2Alg 35-1) TaxID=1347342 RepID=T2KNS4_FORAG|nr:YdeI/OmpD-associated family protein [Formosa agariphila]CDF80380.1 bacteriocin-protection, YdeI or OmpD-associated protein [Formosa agariphila KMM 3901]
MTAKDTEQFCPKNQDDWRTWLALHHKNKASVWLIIYKVNTPNQNLTWSEAVDHALCFGWIDSVKKSIDAERYMQFFTKRKPNSIWSRVNKDKVDYLSKNGLMADAGQACIDIAKTNGSWFIIDTVDALIIPDDLEAQFKNFEGSKAYYESLSNSVKKQLLYWIVSAKREDTRTRRILEIAESASKRIKPKPFR